MVNLVVPLLVVLVVKSYFLCVVIGMFVLIVVFDFTISVSETDFFATFFIFFIKVLIKVAEPC